jgi:uncharacterized membrane protein YhhN
MDAWWPLIFMALDWLAVGRGWKRLEYFAKPAAMVALLAWLALNSAAASGWPPALGWFAAGLVCSLAGDVLLMLSERYFLAGLIAFLAAHLAYIIGLNAGGLMPIEGLLLVPMALIGGWLVWKVGGALEAHGRHKLVAPVTLYTLVISLMVVSAVATLFRPVSPMGAAQIAVGAILFFFSDAVLAWDRFVAPVRDGKLLVIMAYHLGQMVLVAGVALLYLWPGLGLL